MPQFIALYPQPDDVEGFESHYRDVHMPIVEEWPNVTEATVTRVTGTPRGTEAPYHLVSVVSFDSEEEMREALTSDPGRRSGKDAAEMAQRFGIVPVLMLGEEF